jgi:hypothetical protein|tara:strand:+ start:127 stop:300 length:174 start_codon:yes stop_codon:yes gene_type:complete
MDFWTPRGHVYSLLTNFVPIFAGVVEIGYWLAQFAEATGSESEVRHARASPRRFGAG